MTSIVHPSTPPTSAPASPAPSPPNSASSRRRYRQSPTFDSYLSPFAGLSNMSDMTATTGYSGGSGGGSGSGGYNGLRTERTMHPLLDDATVSRVVNEFFRRMVQSQRATARRYHSVAARPLATPPADADHLSGLDLYMTMDAEKNEYEEEDDDGHESDGPGCADDAHLHQLLTYFVAVALDGDANNSQSMRRSYCATEQHVTQRFFDCAVRHLDVALRTHVPDEVASRIVVAVKGLGHDVVTERLSATSSTSSTSLHPST